MANTRAEYYCEILNKIIWKAKIPITQISTLVGETNDLLVFHKEPDQIEWDGQTERFVVKGNYADPVYLVPLLRRVFKEGGTIDTSDKAAIKKISEIINK